MRKKKRIAVVLSEGGINCAYSAGVMYALATKYKFTNPDIVIGCSGSCGTLAYYVSGQYESIKKIWLNHVTDRSFISFLRVKKIIDIDFIIDTVFKKLQPLNIEAIRTSEIKFLIPITDAVSLNPKYFSNSDKIDFFELLRATMAMPFAYGKTVTLDGKEYVDGAIGTTLDDQIETAISMGASDIFVVNNVQHSFLLPFGLSIVKIISPKSKNYLDKFQSKIRTKMQEFIGVNVVRIDPSVKLNSASLNNKSEGVKKSFELGMTDVSKIYESLT